MLVGGPRAPGRRPPARPRPGRPGPRTPVASSPSHGVPPEERSIVLLREQDPVVARRGDPGRGRSLAGPTLGGRGWHPTGPRGADPRHQRGRPHPAGALVAGAFPG